jgi:hypothetical protein
MTMPSSSGGTRPNIDYNIGEADLWKQVGNLAQAAGSTINTVYLLQAEQQFMDATLKAEEEITRFGQSLNENQDEDTYQAELDKSIGTARKFSPKNTLAARNYDNWLRKQSISWKRATEDARQRKIVNKWKATELDLENKAKNTGSTAPLYVHLNTGVALGYMDQDDAQRIIIDTENIVKYNRAMDVAKTRPEELLDSVKTVNGKEHIGILPDITDTGQIMAIKNIAKGAIQDAKIEMGRLKLETTSRLKQYAADPNVDTDMMETKITQSDALSPAQKIEAMSEWRQARNIMAKGGQNPYTTTQNWELYNEDRRKVTSEDITEQEIIDHVGPKGYSWPQAEHLISVLNGKSSKASAFEDSSAAKLLIEMIDGYSDTMKVPKEVIPVLRNKALRLLQDSIDGSEKVMTKRQKEETALRIFNSLKTEALTMGTEASTLMPLGEQLDLAVAENRAYKAGQTTKYKIGDTITKGGKTWKIVDFDTDGTPLVEEL